MSDFYNQHSRRAGAGRPGPQPGAAAPATPGKRTLTQGLEPASAPVQRKPLDHTDDPGGGSAPAASGSDPQHPIPPALLADVVNTHKGSNGLQGSSTDYGRAVMAIWTWCQQSVPSLEAARAYATGPGDPQVKIATIGQMAAARGRLEFLIGWMLQGGLKVKKTIDKDDPKKSMPGDWENTPGSTPDNSTNRGTIVDHYSGSDANYSAGNDWCGMFVGFVMSRLGMAATKGSSEPNDPGDPTDHTALQSSYRILHLLRDANHKPGPGEAVMWLNGERSSTMTAPQPGDVVVYNDHVAMVERYNAEAQTIDTLDGNVGLRIGTDADDSVSGAHRDLVTNAKAGHWRIIALWRPGLDAYGRAPTTSTAPADDAPGQALVAQINQACAQVTQLYTDAGLDGSGAVNPVDSTATIAGNAAK